jgi:hypothetical protein
MRSEPDRSGDFRLLICAGKTLSGNHKAEITNHGPHMFVMIAHMRTLLAVVFLLFPVTAFSQTTITPSQTRLIGCFGEAFTLVEHVWRIAPKHLAQLVNEAKNAQNDARRQFLDGFVSAAVAADQDSAYAVARNLNGCLDEASHDLIPDRTTAILAAAVRTELDSALEDVTDYLAMVKQRQDALRSALRTSSSDARGNALDTYLVFGDRMRDQLTALRRQVDAVVKAATP